MSLYLLRRLVASARPCAEVAIFTDGRCALRWVDDSTAPIEVFESLEQLLAAHGAGALLERVDYQ